MKRNLKLFGVFMKAVMQNSFAYRLGSLLWIINGMIGPLLSMAIWLKISEQSSLPLNQNQLVTYFFMAIIVNRLTQVWTFDHISRWIKNGGISTVLVKPYGYVVENLAHQLSYKTSRLMSLTPMAIITWYVLRNQIMISLDIWRIALFVISVILGFFVIFAFEHVLALLAFWFEEITGINSVHTLLRQLLGGTLIPLAFMPGSLKSIMSIYPTRFIASFPLEILIEHNSPFQAISGFVIATIWILSLVVIYKIMFVRGIKKFTAVGI